MPGLKAWTVLLQPLHVDLVCFLLAPADCGGAHLRALARVSRLLRRPETRQRLRAAPSDEALFAILADDTASAAA